MFCKNCGNEITDTSLFCNKCGSPVNDNPSPVQTKPANNSVVLLSIIGGLLVILSLSGLFNTFSYYGDDMSVLSLLTDKSGWIDEIRITSFIAFGAWVMCGIFSFIFFRNWINKQTGKEIISLARWASVFAIISINVTIAERAIDEIKRSVPFFWYPTVLGIIIDIAAIANIFIVTKAYQKVLEEQRKQG